MADSPSIDERRRAFGGALQKALTVKRMTQVDLAEALGVKQPTVSGWLNAIAVPESPAIVFEVERALDLTPGSLSRHLGFLPIEAVRSVATVRAAIMDDAALSAEEKAMLLGAYEAAAKSRRRRRPKR